MLPEQSVGTPRIHPWGAVRNWTGGTPWRIRPSPQRWKAQTSSQASRSDSTRSACASMALLTVGGDAQYDFGHGSVLGKVIRRIPLLQGWRSEAKHGPGTGKEFN